MNENDAKTCPICGKPSSPKTRPFCSVRCADVDLGRWLTGSYAIPVAEDEEEDRNEEEFPSNRPGHGGSA